jgi:hypothetical protein
LVRDARAAFAVFVFGFFAGVVIPEPKLCWH